MRQAFQKGMQTKPPFYVANVIEKNRLKIWDYYIIPPCHITIFYVTHCGFMEILMDEYVCLPHISHSP